MPTAKTGTCTHCGQSIFRQDAMWWHQGERPGFGYLACRVDVIPAPYAAPAQEARQ